MKRASALLLLMVTILVSGCRSPLYFSQPPLHKPVILDYQSVVINTNASYRTCYKTFTTQVDYNSNGVSENILNNQSWKTNTFPYLVLVQSNKLVEYPPVSSLEYITNKGSIYPIVGALFDYNSDYKNASDSIKASFQIESDADSTEEFGSVFSSCFYVGRVNIHNFDTNLTLIADSSSLWVMTSFYLTEADWKSSPVLQENIRRRYGGEYIRMPRHPLTYKDILAIFEYEQKNNPRQQISDYLDSAGVIASGATLFFPSVVYAHGVDFAIGIVKPEVQKRLLWDLTLHQANFVARTLPDTVKVEPNTGVDGLVFFPKRGIPGYIDEKQVYISSFNSKQTALISGALVSEKNQVNSATLNTVTASTSTSAPPGRSTQ